TPKSSATSTGSPTSAGSGRDGWRRGRVLRAECSVLSRTSQTRPTRMRPRVDPLRTEHLELSTSETPARLGSRILALGTSSPLHPPHFPPYSAPLSFLCFPSSSTFFW